MTFVKARGQGQKGHKWMLIHENIKKWLVAEKENNISNIIKVLAYAFACDVLKWVLQGLRAKKNASLEMFNFCERTLLIKHQIWNITGCMW